ncbi:hypothetical protein LTS08_003155 [Lithohypha guttulata]|nr:hypothetical protein LTS08_003155 [Lithohypha guttulata]
MRMTPDASSNPRATVERQHSSISRSPRYEDNYREDDEDLTLARTRSPEPAVVESIAIPLRLEDSNEVKPDVVTNETPVETTKKWPARQRYLVLLCSFIASLSFGVTQVPLLYVFRLMTCDAYYKQHSAPPAIAYVLDGSVLLTFWSRGVPVSPRMTKDDRCSIHPIESSTALSISLLGASTTVFGLINLFLAGALIKRIGVKSTLLVQLFFPALRLLVQNVGVEVWGSTGIIIIQCSQVLTVVGGPSGYLLCLNSFMTEIVEYEGRTAALGRLTGSLMFGSAVGFLLGGVVAETFGIRAPFRLTLVLFMLSCVYVALCLPYIAPSRGSVEDSSSTGGKWRRLLTQFLSPLAVFAPRKYISRDGSIRNEYGAFLLAWGVFLGILATGYLPTLLQLYATDVFSFGTKQNGWLIFTYSMLRGVFLTFAFPKLIAVGRRWTSRREEETRRTVENAERQPLLQNTDPAGERPDANVKHKQDAFTFDLTYTRFSLVADGLLTLLCTFVHKDWQMYLVAAILPFAAGTGSAAKGTILQMVGSSASSAERTDALAGVSLVENMARLSTTFVFGVVFAGFASIGRPELVFTCNAAVAIVGFGVLLFAHFPPMDSRRLDEAEEVT